MERQQRVRQTAALISAVVLVGGLVIFRAGGFGLLGGSKSNPVFKTVGSDAPTPQQQQPTPDSPEYLSGSKSTFIFSGHGVKPPDPPKPTDKPPPNVTPPANPGE
jgi:hypothetical protein